MTLHELMAALAPTGLDGLAFPQRLIGAFRRKSISFANGLTDETTVVYWFQSRSFTIDLRLADGPATPLCDRQGWVGDTLWDPGTQQLSWSIQRSYQPHNQWPEPARLSFIGNCVLEFAPSGAYVEDWRQQAIAGPMLGLRLFSMYEEATGQIHAMDGGLIIAGDHAAYARSRVPAVDAALSEAGNLAQAMANGIATTSEIESYEVSVASGRGSITHSTQPAKVGQNITAGDFSVATDGTVILSKLIDGALCHLHFAVDIYIPDFRFENSTASTPAALEWLDHEKDHLMRHAKIAR